MAKKTIRQTVLAGLIKARKFIKKGWTQQWFARDKNGERCDEESREATCWCVTGALSLAFPDGGAPWMRSVKELERTTKTKNIVEWNDEMERTQGEVLDAFNDTIKRLRPKKAE